MSALRIPAALGLLTATALAGGSPENAILIVDPSNPVSLQVANRYRTLRDLPDRNVLYCAPNPGSYAAFQASVKPAFLGSLEQLGIEDHVDYVLLSAGSGFQVAASGLVSDGCSAVNRFAVTTPFTIARTWSSVPVGVGSQTSNGYNSTGNSALAFDARTAWASGGPSSTGARYFLAALLGYEGPNGNTVAEILSCLDRSAAVDGARPAGTTYYCQTNDAARSAPRHGFYPAAVAAIAALGLSAQHLFADLPPAGSTCTGIMTGLADPAIDTTALTLTPGSFADHLTSYAGTFDGVGQTKMSRWIAKGASGTSGTVEEPCNYAGKFPHARLHVYYAQGASLGEAWFRSLGYVPFQQLFLGDPLCRPFAYLPVPGLANAPGGAVSGTIGLQPVATTTHPTAAIARFELLVDGISFGETAPGGTWALDTTAIADGWHDLRVLAWDDTGVKSTGRAILPLTTSNFGRSASLAVAPASGDLTTRFDFTTAGAGGTVAESRLLQGSRVVAAGAGNGTLSVYGRTLGADRSRLQLEVEYTDGRIARSAPVTVDVADASGTPGTLAPTAFSCTKRARNDAAVVVELPSTFDAQLASATWTIVAGPAQGSILGGTGPYRIVQPVPGALGADALVFRVTTPAGTSSDATVTIRWDSPPVCPTPAHECTANPNSTGSPATMGWSGSTRIGTNDFRVAAFGLPASSFGVFFYGANATQQPFGDGFRCVASPVIRLGVQQASVFGDVERALDFSAPPFAGGIGAITAGSTQRFQFWYRNPAAGGAGFNTSDALAVTFCP
ncbi:MAG: hypothetical protein NTY35_08510 [Planctomycetota bacterium]|nr:hypothetical protein [Planctomycetota bacterium]